MFCSNKFEFEFEIQTVHMILMNRDSWTRWKYDLITWNAYDVIAHCVELISCLTTILSVVLLVTSKRGLVAPPLSL